MRKLIIFILICVSILTACQPTPQKPVVENKNDGELEQAIVQTAAPTVQEVVQTEEPEPEPIIIEDKSSNASNTVTLEINAEVINNQPQNIPVARIAPYYFTGKDVERMAKAFFGDAQFYQGILSKSDFDRRILKLQYKISNDEELLKSDHATAGGITDLPTLRKLYGKSLDRMIEERKKAPDERPIVEDFNDILDSDWSFMGAYADVGSEYLGIIRAWEDSITFNAFEDDALYPPDRRFTPSCAQLISPDNDDPKYQNAKNMAIDMIERMGLLNVTLGDSYFSEDPETIWRPREGVKPGRQYYVFCFEKKINDSKLDHSLAHGNCESWGSTAGKDGYEDDEVYEKLREYERLQIWIEGDKFVKFFYRMPMQVMEIINENVALSIDYPQAIELAKQHALVKYVDNFGNFSEIKVAIKKIELVLVRTKQANTKDYIVVPAWNFYGSLQGKTVRESKFFKAGEWRELGKINYDNFEYPFITINALDGSIIDMEHGY